MTRRLASCKVSDEFWAQVELLIPARARVGGREGLHVMLTTGATNTLDSGADIARIQEYLGYANIATTRTYDHCKTRPGG